MADAETTVSIFESVDKIVCEYLDRDLENVFNKNCNTDLSYPLVTERKNDYGGNYRNTDEHNRREYCGSAFLLSSLLSEDMSNSKMCSDRFFYEKRSGNFRDRADEHFEDRSERSFTKNDYIQLGLFYYRWASDLGLEIREYNPTSWFDRRKTRKDDAKENLENMFEDIISVEDLNTEETIAD